MRNICEKKTGHPGEGNPSKYLQRDSTTPCWNVKPTSPDRVLRLACGVPAVLPVVDLMSAPVCLTAASWALNFGLGVA